jgi:SAM-dependent methyltransferase
MEIPVEEFDEAFEAVERSARVAVLVREALGGDLPPEVEPYSFVPLAGLRRIATALRLAPGETVVDLACGRGGPGMWVARETGARLVGVDYSSVALAQAQARASLFGLAGRVRFVPGRLHATGLPNASADAVMCVDAFQFGDPSSTALEIARILRPGGRVAATSWRPVHAGDETLPERLRDLDVADALRAANLSIVVNDEEPDWMAMQRDAFELALAAGDPGDDQALANMQREAERVLPNHDRVERVFVVAERPRVEAGAPRR